MTGVYYPCLFFRNVLLYKSKIKDRDKLFSCAQPSQYRDKAGDSMAKTMKISALVSAMITGLFALLYANTPNALLLTLTITFATIAYHFIMRLLVGFVFNLLLHNRVNYRRDWFRVRKFEHKIYKILKVKKWKGKMGTYDPASFDAKIHSWDEIAQATCQAELVHETIIVFSFLPLLAAIPFGALAVFIISSVLAACFDAMFVIMQRFNRPRIVKLIKKEVSL